MYYGDISIGETIDLKFTTRQFSTGAPFALAGTPVISAYPDNSTTQITAGITLTADFDGVTGLNNVRVVATTGNGYAAGTNYALVITTGTVDGVSVVGEVIGSFSIANRAATKARTEPGQGAPPVSTTPQAKLDYLFKNWRNKRTQTGSQWSLYADDETTVDQKKTVQDDGTGSAGEVVSGP